ncbi:mitochondrial 54S ribosomal protein [Saccharomycopsis crataegensis]|uniref:Mitochondrial 54S ribosomal protein n=1 Tax=Saccharomycopsis crataegensis TaxID=43959 RepID=A0AAV5QU98_9ASCO|nr:mitochondrial 54S ribosomal protein [Saccharomycopsis crataegensis]
MSAGRATRNLTHILSISSPSNKASIIKLPPLITDVSLTFKKKNSDGHMGIRKFWQNYLPTIKFYNQSLPMNVTRITLNEIDTKKARGVKDLPVDSEEAKKLESDIKLLAKCPAKITISYQGGKSVELDCKWKRSEIILEEFTKLTKAVPVAEEEIFKFGESQ